MMSNRRLLSTGGLLMGLSLTIASVALCADERNTTSGITAAGKPLAVHGYDPVAFFTESAAKEGSAEFATVYDGATYYFVSQQNLDAFKADSARYAPAFGGFCAFGVSVGKKFDGDPRFWTISGNRLFLNLNQQIAEKFKKDVAGSVAKAEQQWRTIEHSPVGAL